MMPSIYRYTDYREFLRDYYRAKKSQSRAFSYKVFANKAGFPNKGFLHNVINKKRNLSKDGIIKVCQALRLSTAESDFFEALVGLNQAENLIQRNHYFAKLNSVRSTDVRAASIRKLRTTEYAFYGTWYYCVVRSLLDLQPFKGDYAQLAKMVYPPISAWEARKAVAALQQMGLVVRAPNGTLQLSEKLISTSDEVARLGSLNFHVKTTALAKKALEELPPSKRHVTGLTLGISEGMYQRMCQEIEAFQTRLMQMAESDADADRVYQMNFQFFPMSIPVKKS